MTQAIEPDRGGDDLGRYLELVKRITADIWLGRSGFSALRKLESVFYNSVRLVLASSLFVGKRAGD